VTGTAVELRSVGVRYGTIDALVDIDLTIACGQALGIVGPNGSGKSTLLKTIAGLIVPTSGSVSVFGQPPRKLRPGSIAYVPQIEAVDWAFPANVWDVVAMGRFPKLGAFSRFGQHDRDAVTSALEAVHMIDLRQRHISQLSGGQQQRVFIARALAQEPDLLLLDEPTTGVDASTEETLREVVRELVSENMPVVMTTHDLESASAWFDRLMVLDRKILAEGDPETVLDSGAYAGIREHTHTHGHARVEAAP
jgi:ABC-type Mn2+/Zn2+ transport system ATPase subunit